MILSLSHSKLYTQDNNIRKVKMDTDCSPNINDIETIAAKTTKSLSRRIGESLKVIFDEEAKKSGVSANALIGAFLDSCADCFNVNKTMEQKDKLQIL